MRQLGTAVADGAAVGRCQLPPGQADLHPQRMLLLAGNPTRLGIGPTPRDVPAMVACAVSFTRLDIGVRVPVQRRYAKSAEVGT
jgi:hypothetical protein